MLIKLIKKSLYSVQALVKLPEVNQIMMEMSKEMMKAGIIEEMLEDTMETLDDPEELEEDAQAEVDKVLAEITMGKMAKAPAAPEASIALPELPDKEDEVAEQEEEAEEDMEEMQSRLAALRS